MVIDNGQVQSKANLCIISGDPGQGKTTTGVKKLVDGCGITKPPFKQNPNIHLFSNGHLFGLKYIYLPLPKLIELFNVTLNGLPINDPNAIPLIGHGIYLYDEGSNGANARESTSSDTMVIQNLVLQSRKRHIKIIFVAQDVRLLTWEIKKFANEWIECVRPYQDSKILSKRDLITLTVKKDGRPEITFDYHGSATWKYFKSDELHPLSDVRLAKAYSRSYINTAVKSPLPQGAQ